MNYPVPPNEEQRLKQLKEYEVMDSLPESHFDDISKLAAIICDVPITWISLIDENRQWFKSKIGFNLSQTAREASFCQFAIMDEEIFEINNLAEDERFAGNPIVAGGPRVRFYAGAPLRTPGGFNVGTLCVIDTKPKELTKAQKEALRILSQQVVIALEQRKEKLQIDRERKMALDAGALLNTFLENSPSMITMMDREGRYIYANGHALKAAKKDILDLLGKKPSELFPEGGELAERNSQDVLSSGEARLQEYTIKDAEGERQYTRLTFPLIDDDKKVNGTGVIIDDITESRRMQRELKVSNERFVSLFYNSPISMVIADAPTATFIRVNKAFLDTFGYTEDEVVGKGVNDINYIAGNANRGEIGRELQRKGSVRNREFRLLKKNGEEFVALCSIDLVEADGRMQIISAFQDITARKKAELAMAEAKRTAEEATALKSSFLANMSHEIRTPLNAMLGFAEMLSRSDLTFQQRDFIDAIETSGQNLLTIINDILDFSKIEAGMLTLEQIPFSPREVLNSVAAMFLGKAEEKGIQVITAIDPETPPLVSGDQTRFTQVLINLIGNAVKFTSQGSVITECTVIGSANGRVTLKVAVKDTGIGIAADKIQLIFDRFTQAETDTTRTFGGTGLGLSIAKRLVELQGGNIHVDSKPGVGSEFYFTISYDIADAAAYTVTKSTPLQKDVKLKGKRILIAEDNVLNQKLATIILDECGVITGIANNGEEACAMLKQMHYDMVLMDIQMPVLDGYEASKRIRQDLKLTIPVIAMTANALPGERERCINAGMNDYITKPFKPQVLLNTISGFLGKGVKEKDDAASAGPAGDQLLNLDSLREFSSGNPGFMKELIEIFMRQNPKDMNELVRSVAAEDYERIKTLVHTLHSSLGVLGFPQQVLAELRAIEELARQEKEINAIRTKADTVLAVCEKGRIELYEVIKEL